MPPAKSTKPNNEPGPYDWAKTIKSPENIGLAELKSAYRIGFPECLESTRRNCKRNPRCLWGLGEKKWLVEEEDSTAAANEDGNDALRNEGQIVGIQNLGATCYVNSLLQLWFHNPIIRPAILEWEPPLREIIEPESYVPTSPIGQLQAMFARLKLSKQSSVDPSSFVQALELNAGEQQDAQEFSKLLMTLIDELLANSQHQKIRTLIKDSFTGECQYETKCSVCGTKTVNTSVFNELELTVNKHLHESLRQYLKEEVLEGSNQYRCSTCNKNQDALRSTKLKKLPPVLNLQLMRFIYDLETRRKKKVMTPMKFPEEIDMTEYVQEEFRNGKRFIYKLTAVLVHNGKSASSGHYLAHIKDISTGAWYDCNDESVEKKPQVGRKSSALVLSEVDGQEPANGNGVSNSKELPQKKFHSSAGAYMLVYTESEILENPPEDPAMHNYLTHLVHREDSVFESDLAKTKAEKECEDKKKEERQKEVELLYKSKIAALPNTKLKRDKSNGNVNGESEPMDFEESELSNLSFLPSSWLHSWLSDKEITLDTIDLSSIKCRHNKLSPPRYDDNAVLYRIVPTEFVETIYSKYNWQERLTGRQAFCDKCVQEHCRLIKKLDTLEEQHKQFLELVKQTDNSSESNGLTQKVWVSKEDARVWKKNAKQEILFPTLKDQEDHMLLNGDIRCPHGQLDPDTNARKLISVEAWSIITEYFPTPNLFVEDSHPCRRCDEIKNQTSQAVAKNKVAAQKQKAELSDLFLDKNRPDPTENQSTDLYIVPTAFVLEWKRCIKKPSADLTELRVKNNELLCEHNKFKYPLNLITTIQLENATRESIVSLLKPLEWECIKANFNVDSEIKLHLDGKTYTPEVCDGCSSEWFGMMTNKTLDYSYADIYLEKKDDDERGVGSPSGSVVEDDSLSYQVPSKREKKDQTPIINGTRRSTRAKHTRNQKKYHVSSTMTLKDFQLRLMSDYKAMMSDQHLFYDGKELSNRELTFGQHRIRPGSTIYLKVDADLSKDDSIEVESQTQERGFSGTALQGYNNTNSNQVPMEH